MGMVKVRKVMEVLSRLKPTIIMVMVQIGLSGVNMFYKLAANVGISIPILVAYRFHFASAALIPLAFLFEWKKRPKVTWEVLLLTFFCALFGGSLPQNLYAESIALTSATFAAAITNIIPALTFVLAIIFRMERLGLKTWEGKAKVVGTCVCIGGAMLLTFYKGIEFKFSSPVDLLHKSQHSQQQQQQHKSGSFVLGFILAILFCLSYSFTLIMQAKLGKVFPYFYTSTALTTVMGAVQTTVYALCKEGDDGSHWRIGWNIKLLSAAYMGIIGSGAVMVGMMYCVQKRGPMFASAFNPLLLVIVALAASLFLDEKLSLGSVVGAVIIVIGLYTVLWGKSSEMKKLILQTSTGGSQDNDGGIGIGTPSRTSSAAAASDTFQGFIDTGHAILAVPPPPPESDVLEIAHSDQDEGLQDIEDQYRINNRQASRA